MLSCDAYRGAEIRGIAAVVAVLAVLAVGGPAGAQQPDDESSGDRESASGSDETSPDREEATSETQEDAEAGEGSETAGRADGERLTRDEALEAAVADNHGLAIAETRTEIARRNFSLGNADFLPTVRALGRQNHSFGGEGFFGQGQVFTQTSLGIELNWTVFDGLRRFATYDRLAATLSVAELEQRAEVMETLARVGEAYYDVVRQRRLLETFRETRELSKRRLEIAKTRKSAETGSEVDVNLARVELNRDKSAVAEQRIALTESKTELNRLMGRKADRTFRVESKMNVSRSLEYEQTRERALDQNPSLEVARRQRRVASKAVAEAQAQRWPKVQLSLGYNYTEFHQGVAPPFNAPSALEYGIDISVPIFDGFNIGRRIANSRSERVIRETAIRREKTRVRKAVRDAFTAYRRHLERIELAKKSVKVAEENVDVALTQLEAGTVSQVEVRQVQLNVQNARTRLIDARFRAKVAELELRRLTGRLYDEFVD